MAPDESGAMTALKSRFTQPPAAKLRAGAAAAMVTGDQVGFERDEGSQTVRADARERSGDAQFRRAVPILLLTEQEAAEALGVSHRKFQELRDSDWCPKPIVLGPRLLRWSCAELEEAVCRMPRQSTKFESVRDRIATLKSRGGK